MINDMNDDMYQHVKPFSIKILKKSEILFFFKKFLLIFVESSVHQLYERQQDIHYDRLFLHLLNPPDQKSI
jgi:hypothetical protein